MKVLVCLNILQLVFIGFILTKLFNLESQIVAQQTEPSPSISEHSHNANLDANTLFVDDALNEHADFLRGVIHEEITASLRENQTAKLATTPSAKPYAANPPPEVDQEYLSEVQSDFDYYLSDGQISDLNMAIFQSKIAKLDQQNRKEMLRKLVRALNSGELEGRL
ncbi:hypothetical protein [Aliiglaciecola litoralis]|uniref:Uncharacterized protein n=1 Tax=Aliiglaciecola litoralis TaxID=582857 RepID=A0ABP3WQS0_9ALTE